MGRLIDADILLAKVVEANPMGGMIGGKFIEDLIKTEPTAYDVDKTIDELSTKMLSAELYGDEWNGQTVNNLLCMGDVYEIVKGGGIDE